MRHFHRSKHGVYPCTLLGSSYGYTISCLLFFSPLFRIVHVAEDGGVRGGQTDDPSSCASSNDFSPSHIAALRPGYAEVPGTPFSWLNSHGQHLGLGTWSRPMTMILCLQYCNIDDVSPRGRDGHAWVARNCLGLHCASHLLFDLDLGRSHARFRLQLRLRLRLRSANPVSPPDLDGPVGIV